MRAAGDVITDTTDALVWAWAAVVGASTIPMWLIRRGCIPAIPA
jgi:hypothetical protein